MTDRLKLRLCDEVVTPQSNFDASYRLLHSSSAAAPLFSAKRRLNGARACAGACSKAALISGAGVDIKGVRQRNCSSPKISDIRSTNESVNK